MFKKFNELNNDELIRVYKNNSKLQNDNFEHMLDNAEFLIGEYLECWNGGIDYCIDYCIGSYGYTYFKCTDYEKFIDGLKLAQYRYCFLSDDQNKRIEYVETLIDRLNYNINISSKYADDNFNRLGNRIDQIIDELTECCYRRLMNEYDYCYNLEHQLEYFLNQYTYMICNDGDLFVNKEYILFERIESIKCYK